MSNSPQKKHGLKTILKKVLNILKPSKEFVDSASYWEDRYKGGGGSGRGSYNELASFKAKIINDFINRNAINDVIEHGCGDGNQLNYMEYKSYRGFDVSPEAVEICQEKFRGDPDKTFGTNDDYQGEVAELALSLDVIYHLVENSVFESYMRRLFSSSDSYVMIYSSDYDDPPAEKQGHVKNRQFTAHVKEKFPDWELVESIPNEFPPSTNGVAGSSADFYIYRKKDSAD